MIINFYSNEKESPSFEGFLHCCRYVELNPVRAGMVTEVGAYPWSSYRQKTGAEKDCWIDRDPCYLDLSAHEHVRKERYQRYINQGLPEDEGQLITQALQRGQLTGTERFVEEVEKRLGLRIEHRGQGRPRKTRADTTVTRGL